MQSRPLHVSVVHPTGNQNVRELLRALVEDRSLSTFYTTVGRISPLLSPPWPASIARIANKRVYDMLSPSQLKTVRTREIVRNMVRRVPLRRIRKLTELGGPLDALWVSRQLGRAVVRDIHPETNILYGYLGYSAELFDGIQDEGVIRVLEAHHVTMRRLIEVTRRERERSPEWAPTLRLDDLDLTSSHGDADIARSDVIVSPSAQVSESVLEVRPDVRILQIPYGCPEVRMTETPRNWDGRGKLKVLFVGRLQAIKGLADVARLHSDLSRNIEMTIVGHPLSIECRPLERLLADATYLGVLPRGRVLELMSQHHVLVLPSLVEGRSLTVLEALSVGLPAIVTPGTGTEDIVREGGGIVIPTAMSESLTYAVQSILDDPACIQRMSVMAIESARRYSWATYRTSVMQALHSVVA